MYLACLHPNQSLHLFYLRQSYRLRPWWSNDFNSFTRKKWSLYSFTLKPGNHYISFFSRTASYGSSKNSNAGGEMVSWDKQEHVKKYTSMRTTPIHMYSQVHIHTRPRAHIHTLTCNHTFTHMHAHMPLHIHTHSRTEHAHTHIDTVLTY